VTQTEKSARREALLETGLRLFSANAFDELSMDDVAAEAGVAKGLLYYYFGSKRGYYVAVVEAAISDWRTASTPISRTRASGPRATAR
jgi:AcrR family transcriptional regulator